MFYDDRRDGKNKDNNVILFFMFFLIIFDYMLTYLGVNILRIIEEGNPLMKKYMELPFLYGTIIRSIIATFLILLLKLGEINSKNTSKYKSILLKILLIQIIPYSMHIVWIFMYFTKGNTIL